MITICRVVQCKYKVEIKTGDKKYAGTDESVSIKLADDGKVMALDKPGHDDFERGKYVNMPARPPAASAM